MKMKRNDKSLFLNISWWKLMIFSLCTVSILFLYLTGETWGRYRISAGGKDSIAMAGFRIDISEKDIHSGEAGLLSEESRNLIEIKDFTSPGEPDFTEKAILREITIHNSSSVPVRILADIDECTGFFRWSLLPEKAEDMAKMADLMSSAGLKDEQFLDPGEDTLWTLIVWGELAPDERSPELLEKLPDETRLQVKISVRQVTE